MFAAGSGTSGEGDPVRRRALEGEARDEPDGRRRAERSLGQRAVVRVRARVARCVSARAVAEAVGGRRIRRRARVEMGRAVDLRRSRRRAADHRPDGVDPARDEDEGEERDATHVDQKRAVAERPAPVADAVGATFTGAVSQSTAPETTAAPPATRKIVDKSAWVRASSVRSRPR